MPQIVKRLRGRAGQAQRLRRLKRTNGLCEMCAAEQRTREATVVDHIKPLAKGGSDADSNTRNLCDEHHRQVTAEQFGHQVARGTRGIARSGRPTGLDHAWNRDRCPPARADAPRRRPTPPDPPGGRK